MASKLRQCVMVVAVTCGVGLGSVIGGGQASAAPTQGQSSFVDCGPAICTKYWSKEQTATLYDDASDWRWAVARLALQDGLVNLVTQKSQATLDNFENALNDAVTAGGCVQFAWSTGGRGKGTWSYTTHPSYCWSENSHYDSVSAIA